MKQEVQFVRMDKSNSKEFEAHRLKAVGSSLEKHPPVRVWVSSSRLRCVPNGDFSSKESSAVCYAWFVWKKGHHGETTVRWFN